MATATAVRLCPELILIPGRMSVYQEVSKIIRQIFESYTDKIEPLSLDEAYLDVSDSELFGGSATLIAQDIRKTIWNETKLTASAGVAPCKFLAKIASDENKPNGMFVITPETQDEYVKQLELKKIPGVGKVTWQKLQDLGLQTCSDVRNYSQPELLRHFGKFGRSIWDRSHGIDERELSLSRTRKSVGVERTFEKDLHTQEECLSVIGSLHQELIQRYEKVTTEASIKTNGVKFKFDDFQQTTVEHQSTTLTLSSFELLCQEALNRRKGRGIRLIGLSIGLTPRENKRQIEMEF
jgi:DNA polymerase-4